MSDLTAMAAATPTLLLSIRRPAVPSAGGAAPARVAGVRVRSSRPSP